MSQPTPTQLTVMQSTPFDPEAYGYYNWGEWYPLVFSDWKRETLSWKENCYIFGGNSAGMPATVLRGPDAAKMLSYMCVNRSYEKMPVGRTRHAICCSEKGNIMAHGLVLKTAEDEFVSYSLNPYIDYLAQTGEYDVEFEAPYNETFVYQLGGPKSLEIVENAAHEDIHDLKFLHFRNVTIAGHEVRVIRMGMAGSISYEIHGDLDASFDVYDELMRVGEPYGITKLGIVAYMSNHTEDGFPQGNMHFPTALPEHEGLLRWFTSGDMGFYYDPSAFYCMGSYTQDKSKMYKNPYEVGWGHMVNFDHDFLGKEALEAYAAREDQRTIVTLEWNPEDVAKVFASYFQTEEEPYKLIGFPQDFSDMGALQNRIHQDRVEKDGREVGVSMRQVYTLYYRSLISMCTIDTDQAQIGNEVTVIWGDMGHRQLPIRAKVARYPYLDFASNKEYDVETIPHYQG